VPPGIRATVLALTAEVVNTRDIGLLPVWNTAHPWLA
jgi:hypothetical protein